MINERVLYHICQYTRRVINVGRWKSICKPRLGWAGLARVISTYIRIANTRSRCTHTNTRRITVYVVCQMINYILGFFFLRFYPLLRRNLIPPSGLMRRNEKIHVYETERSWLRDATRRAFHLFAVRCSPHKPSPTIKKRKRTSRDAFAKMMNDLIDELQRYIRKS